ncbi:leucyl aminopeptidase [Patescibacteria group bacterium]|nr:leucyl aminopeptidase [Patescibacteria group bacterium]
MKIQIQRKPKLKDALLFAPLFKEDLKKLPGYLPKEAADFVNKRLKAKDFEGNMGQCLSTYLSDTRFLVLGGGEVEKLKAKEAREFGAKLGKKAKKIGLSVLFPEVLNEYFGEFLQGLLLSQYRVDLHKTIDKTKPVKKLEIIEFIFEKKPKNADEIIKYEQKITQGVEYTKDLVNKPSNQIDPDTFEAEARKIRRENRYKIAVLKQKDLEKMGWGGVLAVNSGSGQEARCIVLEYDGGKRSEKPIAIVGKGIMFDSGGYNLKPTKYIETMHQDMAGAATVLGLFKMLKDLKIKKNIVGIMPIAENLINENAYRPSDIIRMFNGKTVEITNTDAEGRLILADGITYAAELKPESIITIATLTGAVSVALGDRFAGLVGNDKKLVKALQEAGDRVDELGWELPIHEDFRKALDSKIADMQNCNISKRGAGCQEGAAFLERFVDKNKWCHIDIGGTAFTSSPREFEQQGATAHGFRMLLEYLKN